MAEPQLILISHPLCPFVQRVAIQLREKGVSFERITVDLENKPDWFLAVSPTGKVPVLRILQDDGSQHILFESVAICEYVEEMYPEPLLHPSNAVLRAQHRAWIEFVSAMQSDAWQFLNASNQEVARVKSADFRKKLELFEAHMSEGPYFSGAGFSMVDVVVAPVFRYFDMLEHKATLHLFEGLERVSCWRLELAQRPSIKNAVAADYKARFQRYLQEHQTLLVSE